MALGEDQPRTADTIVDRVALKAVIARDDVVGPAEQTEMAEFGGTAVAQLDVVGIGVEADADPVRHVQPILRGQELAAVDQHALAARPVRGQPPVRGPRDETVLQ